MPISWKGNVLCQTPTTTGGNALGSLTSDQVSDGQTEFKNKFPILVFMIL